MSADYREDSKEFIKRAIVFNLNGIAKNVIGTMDMSNKNNGMEGKVIFYDQNDRVLYQTSTIRNTTIPIPFGFSVSDVLQLKAEFIA
ncbi:MAG TPA: hypothetical protein DEF04_00055, partial [Clostridiales bacterium]|nr:hypothetical protein [Clostridiales bacterium]